MSRQLIINNASTDIGLIEEWRPVPDYEDRYLVSNMGRIKSIGSEMSMRSCYGKKGTNILHPSSTDLKYKRIGLFKDGKRKYFSVHRLVALAFIPRIEGKDVVNHIDCNPSNNCVTNLEWCNTSENTKWGYICGNVKPPKVEKGSKNHRAKKIIRLNDGKIFGSLVEAAEEIGAKPANISMVLHGTNKTIKGYSFAFYNDQE